MPSCCDALHPEPEEDPEEDAPLGISELVARLESRSRRFGLRDPQTLAAAHQLAIALWDEGDLEQAIGLLDQAIERSSSLQGIDPIRAKLLGTLGEIAVEQDRLEQACEIYREVLECVTRCSGANHPSSLAAKGDLAFLLFALGSVEEANELERDAAESARIHLGQRHPVRSVLAWNRALRRKQDGDANGARDIVSSELAWLLTEDPASLEEDQNTIRNLLTAEPDCPSTIS